MEQGVACAKMVIITSEPSPEAQNQNATLIAKIFIKINIQMLKVIGTAK